MSFWEQGPINPDFDFAAQKKALIENMEYQSTMSVEEQTLYKKWLELQEESMLINRSAIARLYDTQWNPTDINDVDKTVAEIEALDPYIELVTDSDGSTRWAYIRKMIHSMGFTANPGRNVKVNVKDRVSGKILGQVSLASDVTSMAVRDKYIGWSKDDKFKKGKLNYTTIASTIVCTQPLGYNFLGGKLVSALVTCSTIRDKWKENYNQTLVGITTTALYGVHSQYNGIPHWKTLGETAGQINLKPDDSIYLVWNQWLKENHPEEHHKAVTATGPKNNVINRIFKHLGMKAKDYEHGFKRGVYFADIYENGKEFFKSNIEEKDLVMKEKYQLDYDRIISWWKPKAIRRYEKLHSENKLKPEPLFYSDIMDMSWEETKEKYLGEVGR